MRDARVRPGDPTTWTPDDLSALRAVGDPAADAAVGAVIDGEGIDGGRRLLSELLRAPGLPGSADLPEPIAAFLAAAGELPDWADPALLARSGAFFETHGWAAFSVLALASLPEGYSVGHVDRVLSATRQLERHVHRRLWETMQFTVDVMAGDGIAGTTGLDAARKVRLMHALMRHLIETAPDAGDASGGAVDDLGGALLRTTWRTEDGRPINQLQMAGTVLAFGWVILRGLRQLGYTVEPDDERAFLHAWNVVGHVMGVDDRYLVDDFTEGYLLFHAIRDPDVEATEEGRQLTAALLGFVESQVPWWARPLRPVPTMLTWYFVGSEIAAVLGIGLSQGQRRLLRPMVLVMLWWGRWHHRLLRTLGPARLASRWLFRRLSRGLIGRPRGGRRGAFTVDDRLLDGWRRAPVSARVRAVEPYRAPRGSAAPPGARR